MGQCEFQAEVLNGKAQGKYILAAKKRRYHQRRARRAAAAAAEAIVNEPDNHPNGVVEAPIEEEQPIAPAEHGTEATAAPTAAPGSAGNPIVIDDDSDEEANPTAPTGREYRPKKDSTPKEATTDKIKQEDSADATPTFSDVGVDCTGPTKSKGSSDVIDTPEDEEPNDNHQKKKGETMGVSDTSTVVKGPTKEDRKRDHFPQDILGTRGPPAKKRKHDVDSDDDDGTPTLYSDDTDDEKPSSTSNDKQKETKNTDIKRPPKVSLSPEAASKDTANDIWDLERHSGARQAGEALARSLVCIAYQPGVPAHLCKGANDTLEKWYRSTRAEREMRELRRQNTAS